MSSNFLAKIPLSLSISLPLIFILSIYFLRADSSCSPILILWFLSLFGIGISVIVNFICYFLLKKRFENLKLKKSYFIWNLIAAVPFIILLLAYLIGFIPEPQFILEALSTLALLIIFSPTLQIIWLILLILNSIFVFKNKSNFNLERLFDLEFFASLLFFVLLGFGISYWQSAIGSYEGICYL